MRPASLTALVALVAALAAAPQAASAQSIAYAVPGSTNVRAGPGTQYPVVARVRGGVRMVVFGCLSDRAWCDAQVYETRGWISSRRLEFVYAGSRVLVPDYYSYFDAPIISFNFGYWDRFYDDRPFYRRWRRHQPSPEQRPGDVTNWPGIEHPGSASVDQGAPQGEYQDPGPGVNNPPVTDGYQQPGDSVGGGVTGGGGPGGEQMPPGVCPPGIVCP